MPRIFFNTSSTKDNRKNLRREATPQEVILWSRLRNNRVFPVKFRRQHGIGPYIVDFYCPEKRLVVEIDGSQHFQDDAIMYDEKRTEFLKMQKCAVLRFTNTDINTNIVGVLEVIMEKLAGL